MSGLTNLVSVSLGPVIFLVLFSELESFEESVLLMSGLTNLVLYIVPLRLGLLFFLGDEKSISMLELFFCFERYFSPIFVDWLLNACSSVRGFFISLNEGISSLFV